MEWIYPFESFVLTWIFLFRILDCHAGLITGIECLPHAHQLVSIGQDATLRIWNYLERSSALVSKLTLNVPLTAVSAARKNVMALGCERGVLRVYELKEQDTKRGK